MLTYSHRKLKDRIEEVRSGKLDHQLPALLDEIKMYAEYFFVIFFPYIYIKINLLLIGRKLTFEYDQMRLNIK